MSIPTGFYNDITKNYYGINPASANQEEVDVASLLWNEFLSQIPPEESSYFYVIGGTDEAAIKEAIVKMAAPYTASSDLQQAKIEEYAADLAKELVARRNTSDLVALTSTNPADVAALFTTLLSPYVQPVPALFVSVAEELAIMNADPQNQKIYLDFLSSKLQKIHESEAPNALSPLEIQNRQITYTLFEILLTLINISTNSQTLAASSMQVLTNKEKEYTDLMSRVKMYVGSGEIRDMDSDKYGSGSKMSTEDWLCTKTIPSDDPTQFDLGYYSLKLQDVFDYMTTTAISRDVPGTVTNGQPPNTKPTTFRLLSGISADIWGNDQSMSVPAVSACTMTIQKETSGYTITTTFTYKSLVPSSPGIVIPAPWTTTSTKTVPLTSESTLNDELSSSFYTVYNRAKDKGYVGVQSAADVNPYGRDYFNDLSDDDKYIYLRAHNLMIPWGVFATDDYAVGSLIGPNNDLSDNDTSNYYGLASKGRQDQNKQLNTYLQGIKSKKDLVSDLKDTQSSVMDGGASARKHMLNLVQSITKQLKTIISSIYK